MNNLILAGVGTISSFSFFQPESLKQDEKRIVDESVDPAYKENGLDYFDQTDGLQAPYSGYNENFLSKFKRKAHQPQDEENIFTIRLYPTRRKSRYEYQTVDYYETTDDLRAPFDKNLNNDKNN